MKELNLSNLSSPGTVIDLTVRFKQYTSGSGGTIRVSGLKKLHSLRSLTVNSSLVISGLEDVVHLASLQRVSFSGLWDGTYLQNPVSVLTSNHFQKAPEPRTNTSFWWRPNVQDYKIPSTPQPQIKTVNIGGSVGGLMEALAKFPNVDNLTLEVDDLSKRKPVSTSFGARRESAGLEANGGTAPSMELDPADEDRRLILPWIAQHTKLRVLNLRFGSKDPGNSVRIPAQRTLDVGKLSELERLSVDGEDENFHVTGLNGLTALKELSVEPSILLDQDLSVLPRLERLDILGDPREDQTLWASIARMRSLKFLCTRYGLPDGFETSSIERVRLLISNPILRKLPSSVKYLEFAESCNDSDSFILPSTFMRVPKNATYGSRFR